MKKLSELPSPLFSKQLQVALKLQEQPYIILIPKSILEKYGIYSDEISFDLVLDNNRISLLGPKTRGSPEANQSSAVTDT